MMMDELTIELRFQDGKYQALCPLVHVIIQRTGDFASDALWNMLSTLAKLGYEDRDVFIRLHSSFENDCRLSKAQKLMCRRSAQESLLNIRTSLQSEN